MDSIIVIIITIIVSLSGWAAFLNDRFTSIPRIKGSIIGIMTSTWTNESLIIPLTSILAYVYVINTRKNPVKLIDYELEIDMGEGYRKLTRVYGQINNPVFQSTENDIDIPDLNSKLIYAKNSIMEYGIPMHGFIPFISNDIKHDEVLKMKRIKLICIDAFGKRHAILSKPSKFRSIEYLQEIAGIKIAKKKQTK